MEINTSESLPETPLEAELALRLYYAEALDRIKQAPLPTERCLEQITGELAELITPHGVQLVVKLSRTTLTGGTQTDGLGLRTNWGVCKTAPNSNEYSTTLNKAPFYNEVINTDGTTSYIMVLPVKVGDSPDGFLYVERAGAEFSIVERRAAESFAGIYSDKLTQRLHQEVSYRAHGSILPKIQLEGGNIPESRNDVSILFLDMRGFSTTISQIQDPEKIRTFTALFQRLVMAPVIKNGGEVLGTAGDALMATITGDSHTLRMMEISLQILDILKDPKSVLKHPYAVRIGVASTSPSTGPVTVGFFGSPPGQSYTAMGHPTNMAARLEQTRLSNTQLAKKVTREEGVLIDEATYKLLLVDAARNEKTVEATDTGKLELKGIGNVQTYLVTKITSTVEPLPS